MRMRNIGVVVLGVALSGCASVRSQETGRVAHVPGTTEQTIASDTFLRMYAESFRFRAGAPSGVTITPGGHAVLFLQSAPGSRVQDLYEMDTATGAVRVLLTAEQILGGEDEALSAEEIALRERMRSSARGIARFALSRDGRSILVPLSGGLYVVDRATGGVTKLPESEDFSFGPKLSPDASKVACAEGDELVVYAVGEDERVVLADSGGVDGVSVGRAEFVAQEEMSRYDGFWWSPTSEFVVYQRTDERDVEFVTILDPFDLGNKPQSWRYPRPGKANAVVELGVVPASGGETVWVEWDRGAYPYLATVRWSEGAPLTLCVQNRAQTELLVLVADHRTGSTRVVHREVDEAWINLDQAMPEWLKGGGEFLWMTERHGAWQLERRSVEGGAITLNDLDFGLRGFIGMDEGRGVAYVNASEDPTESHVYALALDGSGVVADYTSFLGGVHSMEFEEGTDIALHTAQSLEDRARTYVRRVTADDLGDVVAEVPRLTPEPGFTTNLELTTVEGSAEFHALIVRPRDFDPGKAYAVILHVYGGPHSLRVVASEGRYLMDQWIADHGYIVVWIDGRGTPNRGRDWERTIRHNFIDAPLADQVEALGLLGARYPEMDMERVGVFGWSFGGYFSAMAAMRHPEVFDCGIAGAPVTDWMDYDTHYTERYIGVPGEDELAAEAYRVSNVLTYVDRLEVPLLIIHGTADDNVYLTHALKMSDALTRAGGAHEFMPLPGHTHMVVEPVIVKRMHERMLDFFREHLSAAD